MIAAYAPATVSNVACGFDVLGFALDEPGDVVAAAAQDGPGVTIAAIHGDLGPLPLDPRRNTAGAAVQALLDRLQPTPGGSLTRHKGLPPASVLIFRINRINEPCRFFRVAAEKSASALTKL